MALQVLGPPRGLLLRVPQHGDAQRRLQLVRHLACSPAAPVLGCRPPASTRPEPSAATQRLDGQPNNGLCPLMLLTFSHLEQADSSSGRCSDCRGGRAGERAGLGA